MGRGRHALTSRHIGEPITTIPPWTVFLNSWLNATLCWPQANEPHAGASQNQVRLLERVDSSINRVVEMGFLRRLRGTEDRYEVRRIMKAFVDAQWLGELEVRLAGYREHAGNEAGQRTDANEHR